MAFAYTMPGHVFILCLYDNEMGGGYILSSCKGCSAQKPLPSINSSIFLTGSVAAWYPKPFRGKPCLFKQSAAVFACYLQDFLTRQQLFLANFPQLAHCNP